MASLFFGGVVWDSARRDQFTWSFYSASDVVDSYSPPFATSMCSLVVSKRLNGPISNYGYKIKYCFTVIDHDSSYSSSSYCLLQVL